MLTTTCPAVYRAFRMGKLLLFSSFQDMTGNLEPGREATMFSNTSRIRQIGVTVIACVLATAVGSTAALAGPNEDQRDAVSLASAPHFAAYFVGLAPGVGFIPANIE